VRGGSRGRRRGAAASGGTGGKGRERAAREAERAERERRRNPSLQDQMMWQVGRSVQRQFANRIAGQIVRGVLGSLFGRR
jgi:hypothetical protein